MSKFAAAKSTVEFADGTSVNVTFTPHKSYSLESGLTVKDAVVATAKGFPEVVVYPSGVGNGKFRVYCNGEVNGGYTKPQFAFQFMTRRHWGEDRTEPRAVAVKSAKPKAAKKSAVAEVKKAAVKATAKAKAAVATSAPKPKAVAPKKSGGLSLDDLMGAVAPVKKAKLAL